MTTFESRQTQIHKNSEELFNFFSDLNNIEKFKDKIPNDKIQGLEYTTDSLSVSISPVGRISFRISERNPFERVMFVTEDAPVALQFEVLLYQQQQEEETIFQVIAKADINPFIKPMISKPLQDAVDKIAETFAMMFNHV